MNQDQRLDDLLDRWEDAHEAGQNPDLDELCRDCPDLLDALTCKVEAINKMDKCLVAHESPAPEPVSRRGLNASSVSVEAKLVDLRFHDRGGLGIVYKAHDHELHRDVAVKLLHEKIARNEEDRLRFNQEAEITGRLDHPGVVPVYAMGQTGNSQPFYVMRFIRGDTYDDKIKQFHKSKSAITDAQQRVALRKLIVQLVSVCQTIGYAHIRGIVHRDIKPKNIMCGKHGEILVVDWGLAIPFVREGPFRVDHETTLNPKSPGRNVAQEGEGTPVYMSPEQAVGRADIDPASDIYSLGIVLYKALTGELAFDGNNPLEIKTKIANGEFEPPRKIDTSIPRPLEAICMKAMALLPANRYETADAMAEDLEAFLADAPVQCYQYSATERAIKFIRNNMVMFVSLLAGSVLLAAVSMSAATVFFNLQKQANQSLTIANQSQVESMNLTCRMTARTIQYNLEARLIALEELVDNPIVIEALESKPEDVESGKLDELMAVHRQSVQKRLPSVSWFLLNTDGKLISRVSDDKKLTPTENLACWTRPYFHGGEQQLDSAKDNLAAPLSEPKLSPAFHGKYKGRQLCSLSVPVKSDADDVIGVLVMTMQMGQFDPLIEREATSATSSTRFATLVETRGELAGSLLHHPALTASNEQQGSGFVLSDSVLSGLQATECTNPAPLPIADYSDPLGGSYSGVWKSVAMPILVRSRSGATVSCGWFIIVQDRPYEVAENKQRFAQ